MQLNVCRNILFPHILVIVFAIFMLQAKCPGPTEPDEKYKYDFPLKIGKTWTYQHYFAAVPQCV
jgi:hypothetical protein